MTTIYLIRHGQAEGNYYRRCHSWHNGLLTQKGRAQLQLLERRFENIHIDAVYSSDLYRAMSTAGAIYRPRGLPLRVDPDLREIGAGVWEDLPWGQLLHDHRESLASFLTCDPDWHIEGGERFAQVQDRIQCAVARIAAAHPSQTVAVVSHGCAIRAGLSAWLGMSVDGISQIPLSDNTGVAKLEAGHGQIKVVYYNDNSHLGALASPIRAPGRDYALSGIEANALYFRPLSLAQDSASYLSAWEEGWQTEFGTMNGFDAPALSAQAQKDAGQCPKHVLYALLNQTPVGVLHTNLQRDAQQGIGWIRFLYMAPEFRGKGLSVQLLGQAVSAGRAAGLRYLRVCCPQGSRAGRAYCLAHGFHPIYSGQGLDVLEKYIGLEL